MNSPFLMSSCEQNVFDSSTSAANTQKIILTTTENYTQDVAQHVPNLNSFLFKLAICLLLFP